MEQTAKALLEAVKRRSPSGNILLVICAVVFAFFIIKGIAYKSGGGSICESWYSIKVSFYEKLSHRNQDRFRELFIERECP